MDNSTKLTNTATLAKLREVRLGQNMSLGEAAKKIGVHKTYLSKVENGHIQISKKVLQKLIYVYNIPEKDLSVLFSLPGHVNPGQNASSKEVKNFNMIQQPVLQQNEQSKELNVNLPSGRPILYTNSAFVTSDPYGVIFDFAQTMGPTNNQEVVARIGMSKEHAIALFNVLRERLFGKVSDIKN